MSIRKKDPYLIILFIFFFSCNMNQVYDEVVSLSSDGWTTRDTLRFNVPIMDTVAVYDVLIHVRNEKTYNYSNLWLFIETEAPNGRTMLDTLEIILADDEGNWLGKGIGNVNTLLYPYLTQVRFRYRGIYTFSVIQGMRDTNLEEMLDVGLRVDYHK